MSSRPLPLPLLVAVAVVLGCAGITAAQDAAGADQDRTTTNPGPEARKTDPFQPRDRNGSALEKSKSKAESPGPKIEKATFGGGCFWCMEAVFERIHGVKSVVSGYAGGSVPYPTYEQVHTGLTGHAEVIQITYDSRVVGFDKLLSMFWEAHDPTSWNRQGDDYGPQYRSIILFQSEEQKRAALKAIADLTSRHVYRSRIVTEVVPLTQFYPAEGYHQNYYRNHRYSEYSQIYITPKLRKLAHKAR